MKIAKTCVLLFMLLAVFGCDSDEKVNRNKRPESIISKNWKTVAGSKDPIGTAEERKMLQQKKKNQIHELTTKLVAKRVKYSNTISSFSTEINIAKKAISKYIADRRANSYEEVKDDTVVTNNLEVIQKAEAYSSLFEHEVELIKKSELEMDKMASLARVDMIAISSLDDTEEFEKILAKINTMIEDVQPHAKESVIGKDLLKKKPLKDIWNKHFSRTKTKTSPRGKKRKTSVTKSNLKNSFSYKHELGKPVQKSLWNTEEKFLASLGHNKVVVWNHEKNVNMPIIPGANIHFIDIKWKSNTVLAVASYNTKFAESQSRYSDIYHQYVAIQLYDITSGELSSEIYLGYFYKSYDFTIHLITNTHIIFSSYNFGISIIDISDLKNAQIIFSANSSYRLISTLFAYPGIIISELSSNYFDISIMNEHNEINKKKIMPCKVGAVADSSSKWRKNDQIIDECLADFDIKNAAWNKRYNLWAIHAKSKDFYHIIVWDVRNRKKLYEIKLSTKYHVRIEHFSWTPDDKYLSYVQTREKNTVLYFKERLKNEIYFEVPFGTCQRYYWHPNKKTITLQCHTAFRLIDLFTQDEVIVTIPNKEKMVTSNWSSSGKYLTASTSTGQIYVWKDVVKNMVGKTQ